jgi:hypothetical protein
LYKQNGLFNKEASGRIMPFNDRRTILRAAATLPVFAGLTSTASAQATSTEPQKPAADQVKRIELKVHPLVLEPTGKKPPRKAWKASSASTMRLRWR